MLRRVDSTEPKNDAQITFRLPTADKKDLKEAAKDRKRPGHNWLARDIVLKWLAQERKRKARKKARSLK